MAGQQIGSGSSWPKDRRTWSEHRPPGRSAAAYVAFYDDEEDTWSIYRPVIAKGRVKVIIGWMVTLVFWAMVSCLVYTWARKAWDWVNRGRA